MGKEGIGTGGWAEIARNMGAETGPKGQARRRMETLASLTGCRTRRPSAQSLSRARSHVDLSSNPLHRSKGVIC